MRCTSSNPAPNGRLLFARAWPGWRAWYLARGGDPEPRLDDAERALRRHMPELERPWRRQVELAGGGELAANFLTFWYPPAYLVHCSQAVLLHHDGPLLVRNYDLDPKLSEATVLCSAWTGRRVIATMEGIAGAADGINDAGLAVSLTFGGRQVAAVASASRSSSATSSRSASARRTRSRPAARALAHGLQRHHCRPGRRPSPPSSCRPTGPPS